MSILGAVVTMLCIPPSGEALQNEDEAWRLYLEENGIDMSGLGEPLVSDKI